MWNHHRLQKPSSSSLEKMERSRPTGVVICDKKVPVKLKHKIYETLIKNDIIQGLMLRMVILPHVPLLA